MAFKASSSVFVFETHIEEQSKIDCSIIYVKWVALLLIFCLFVQFLYLHRLIHPSLCKGKRWKETTCEYSNSWREEQKWPIRFKITPNVLYNCKMAWVNSWARLYFHGMIKKPALHSNVEGFSVDSYFCFTFLRWITLSTESLSSIRSTIFNEFEFQIISVAFWSSMAGWENFFGVIQDSKRHLETNIAKFYFFLSNIFICFTIIKDEKLPLDASVYKLHYARWYNPNRSISKTDKYSLCSRRKSMTMLFLKL